MDVYLLVSMFFVFSTIMEFAVVLNLDQAMRFTERLRKQDSDVLDSNKLSKRKMRIVSWLR